jgi:hypothetical protein
MTNITQQLLENMEQHARAHVVETERACQARLMIDVARHAERHYITCIEDQFQAGQHMALRDLQYPLADPQVDRQVLGRLNEQCNHCGSRFWIEECTGGSLRRPHYSKCCASGKFFCLLFAPHQSTWQCYKIDKMPNYVNIFVYTMLHSHLRPQGSRVWASNSD